MKTLTALAMTAALAIAPAMASATTTITYTGVIGDIHTSGDADHYFGAGVTFGTAYSLVYTINDGAGGTETTPQAFSRRLDGAGAVTAVMTINGISQSVGGTYLSHVLVEDARPDIAYSHLVDYHGEFSQDFVSDAAHYSNRLADSWMSSYLSDFIHGTDYHTAFSYTPVGADSYFNTFVINEADWVAKTGNSIFLNLAPGTVTAVKSGAAAPGPVPEPASWALMLGGFALAGGAMRVRKGGMRLRFA